MNYPVITSQYQLAIKKLLLFIQIKQTIYQNQERNQRDLRQTQYYEKIKTTRKKLEWEATLQISATPCNEKGPMGIFEHIKDSISSLPGMILDGIIGFVRNRIIVGAMTRIMLMLNPAGAIIGIIKGIYDVVMFFVNNWNNILEFANSVMNSITEIAKGKVDSAISWIEKSLANSIPVLIGFLAQFASVGNVSSGILGIIKKVKGKIDSLVGKVVKKVAGVIKKSPIYAALTATGKKVATKVANVKDKAVKKIDDVKSKVQNKMTGNKGKKGDKGSGKKPKGNEITPQDKTKYGKWVGTIITALEKDKGKKDKSFEEFANAKKSKAASLDSSYQGKVKPGVKVEVKVTSQDKTKGIIKFSASILLGGTDKGSVTYDNKGNANALKWWKIVKNFTNKGGEKHKLFFGGEGKSAILKIASNPMDAIVYLQSKEVKDNPNNKPILQKAGNTISKIIGITRKFPDPKAKLTEAQEKQLQNNFDELQSAMEQLKDNLEMIASGNADLIKLYKDEIEESAKEAQPEIIKQLSDEKKNKVFIQAKTWKKIANILISSGKLQKMDQKPLSRQHEFGVKTQEDIAIPALKEADKKGTIKNYANSIAGREKYIHNQEEPYGPKPMNFLQEALFKWNEFSKKAKNALFDAFDKMLNKPASDQTQKHHVIPWDNSTYNHQESDLVKTAKIDLKTFSENMVDVKGHAGPHCASYHLRIVAYLQMSYTKLEKDGKLNEVNAKNELIKIIKKIIDGIKDGSIKLYNNKEVTI